MIRNSRQLIGVSAARLDFILALVQHGDRCGRRTLVREFGTAAVSRQEEALSKLGFIRNDDGRSLTLTPSGKRAVRRILSPLEEPASSPIEPLAVRRVLRLASEAFSAPKL